MCVCVSIRNPIISRVTCKHSITCATVMLRNVSMAVVSQALRVRLAITTRRVRCNGDQQIVRLMETAARWLGKHSRPALCFTQIVSSIHTLCEAEYCACVSLIYSIFCEHFLQRPKYQCLSQSIIIVHSALHNIFVSQITIFQPSHYNQAFSKHGALFIFSVVKSFCYYSVYVYTIVGSERHTILPA